MRIERRYTKEGQSAYADIEFRLTASEIRNPDGSVVFKAENVEVPASWSQVAADVLAQKYFRKAGLPARLKKVEEPTVPSWLWRSVPDSEALALMPEKERSVGEHSSKQVFERLAGTWTYWGWKGSYFDSEADARAFFDELVYMLAMQMAAPNSPQWFNTGLHWAYGIDGPSQGHFYVDFQTGKLVKSKSAYEHPQPHACFIQSIKDDLVNEGGIMDLWVREARLFKYGSGTGTNFSKLRGDGEKLAGGGRSSGLMSFLKIGDRAAGAIKSGGTTRRAAKMVIVDTDHPDIEQFIDWKVNEEQKVANLVTGSKINQRHLRAVIKACVNCEGSGDDCFDPEKNPVLRREIKAARRNHVPDPYIKRVIQFARQGHTDLNFPIYDTDWDSDAYLTVSGQNSNNTVRVTDEFLKTVEADGEWDLTWRTSGKIAKTLKARDLWDKIGYAAWASADPGLQFHTAINDWHTCPASGEIRASNPCSEYMFLDDTACNLASLNLLAFRTSQPPAAGAGGLQWGQLDLEGYEHAVRLWTVVLEISVMMAQFPSKEIAQLSFEFRTLGLGYANIGGLLMSSGIPYDSDAGRQICGTLTSIMTGVSYATSAEMAAQLGAFPGYKKNREHMLRVIRNHRRAAHGERSGYEKVATPPVPLDHKLCPDQRFTEHAMRAWDRALALGGEHGFRNAQVSVIAPTGTIALVMDCDTTGIEPDFALVKFKKLAGGGYFKIINRAVPEALRVLGYGEAHIAEIEAYAVGHGSLGQAPAVNHATLKAKGFTPEAIERVEKALPTAFDIKFAFNKWTLGEAFCREELGIESADLDSPSFDLLAHIGFSRREIDAANIHVCGAMTVEGAPHLKARALRGVRLRQSVRAHRQALSLGREPHPHAGGSPALHHRRHLQDHQHAQRRHGRGLQGGVSVVLEARPQGQCALPRRLQALAAAAVAAHRRRRRRGGDRGLPGEAGHGARRGAGRAGGREGGRAHRGDARPRAHARPPQGLYPEGGGGRPQGLSAHRRIRRRPARRDLHRHAQGGRGAALDPQQLRDRGLARPAIRRAARRICRCLHVHPLRAVRPGAGQRLDQILDLDPRLRVPRAGGELSGALRPRPCRPQRGRRRLRRARPRRRGRQARSGRGPLRLEGIDALAHRQARGHARRCGDLCTLPPRGGGSRRECLQVTAMASGPRGEARAEAASAAALRTTPEQKLSPTERLEQQQLPFLRSEARANAAERRAQAKAKGYEGEACGECGNFTLVRNGTCMKCDTCGSTTGCS